MPSRFKVCRTEEKGAVWSIPQTLINRLHLTAGASVVLNCGSSAITVKVGEPRTNNQGKNSEMGLSSEILKALKIPPNTTLLIKSEGSGAVRLGPVIGILTFPGHVSYGLKFYKSWAQVNKDNGILYVFRGGGLKPADRTVTGYYFDQQEQTWQQASFPYPDVVIDRCYPNAYVSHILLEKVIGRGKIFNKRTMITKVDFAKALDKDPFVRNHVPETWVFQNISQLTDLLSRYEQVFLKPVNGMKGIGIVVAQKSKGGRINCSFMVNKGNRHSVNIAPAEISKIIIKAAGHRRPYVIQQGIPRMEYQRGPFSIRSWAMKNGKGQWVMPGMFSKGSVGESFLTNFTAGAKLVPLRKLLDDIVPRLPYSKSELLTLIEKLTLQAAQTLDARFGPLGELGFDIVFDKQGKPWLIEANGNPGIGPIFLQKEYPLWPSLLYLYPLNFATYLAGFKGSDLNT